MLVAVSLDGAGHSLNFSHCLHTLQELFSLSSDELRQIKVETCLTRNEFETITGVDTGWIEECQFTFGTEEM